MTSRGLLLANLGSPDSPSESDVRAYLDEFLMDPRIIDMPYPLRWLIVKRFILPKRPAQSAHAYQTIWWEEGSPLIVLTDRVRAKLEARLDMPVTLGMRYGNPSVRAGLEALLAQMDPGGEVILLPMYPHYAMSTYETLALKTLVELHKLMGVRGASDRAAQAWLRSVVSQANGRAFGLRVGDVTLRIIPPHYNHPGYIAALAASMKPALAAERFDYVLFSYHGIPERHLHKTAPKGAGCLREGCCTTATAAHALCYRHQAFTTTRLAARKLGLRPDQYAIAFQSRLGRDKWLEPATADELVRLPRAGVKRLAVVAPSFTVDCLETLEEIGMAGRETFLDAGGEVFQRIPCLNDRDDWVEVMAGMVEAPPSHG
ncbi:MAG TPA: ferrochelatase [Anaerolineae bacterium]|nr:ferrochelatase [Anaerolineae bacterium]HIQ11608.1 ferrochelatase [Caldilineales bacterium]